MIRFLRKNWVRAQRVLNRTDHRHHERLEALLGTQGDRSTLRQIFGHVDDDFWLWCFTEGYRSHDRLRSMLPGYPADDVQLRFAGASGDDTLRDAFRFYQLARRLAASHGVSHLDSVLEFGCGWGRIIRFFLRDVERQHLWGIDCLPLAVETCQKTNPYATFSLVDTLPPTTVPSASFDLIYAYSVFSHLSEAAHLAWLDEFVRLLKPRGLLIVTTRPRDFVTWCEQLRQSNEPGEWALGLKMAFPDAAAALRRYDGGEYIYHPLGGGDVLDASFFGETCIPREYVVQKWAGQYDVLDFIDDRAACTQNVIVARKK